MIEFLNHFRICTYWRCGLKWKPSSTIETQVGSGESRTSAEGVAPESKGYLGSRIQLSDVV